MDTALSLRLAFEQKAALSTREIDCLLAESALLKKIQAVPLTTNGLANLFTLVGLAEIPHVERLDYTKNLIEQIEQTLVTPQGFSYTGNADFIVPCYNAMLLEAYARLGMSRSSAARNALDWIKRYQLFERQQQTTWTGKGIQKHGGCLNATPCYIGIGKTVRALITWQEYQAKPDAEVTALIEQGLQYMLQHRFFLRLTADSPISRHITSSVFPQSYLLSLTDLVYIAGKGGVTSQPNTQPLLQLLEKKQTSTGGWKLEYIYKYPGYTSFETRRYPSDWLTKLYPLWLKS